LSSTSTFAPSLIDNILDLSKVEAGKLEPVFESLDSKKVVQNALQLVSSHAEQSEIKLSTDWAHNLPPLFADERLLKQMLINLLSNAVKFTPQGGTITVAISATENSATTIKVSDTGIGMKADDIPLAMEKFGQVDSSLSRQHNGTGLGLPLVKSFMELHGGRLEFESQSGIGTVASLIFPDRAGANPLPA